ncbi:hypothetical protein, partial [Mesorhizobium sp. M8A.F.Ca.ET.181.01.1.1]|uniref:hypothetical protein n=1 Tax=Mesorhizobium sp. M8A.F.Ca.ET.181.01.1.1 TaxID=2563963 RepID=UPI001AEEBA68
HALSTGVEDAKAILVPPDLDQRFGLATGTAASGICLRLQALGCARIVASNFSADLATEAACSKNSARWAEKT